MSNPSDSDGNNVEQVTHKDIYLILGKMMGRLDSLQTASNERREDLAGAFSRIKELEGRMGIGLGLAIAVSFASPLLFRMALGDAPFGPPAASHAPHVYAPTPQPPRP